LQFQEGQVVFLNQLFIGKAEISVIAYPEWFKTLIRIALSDSSLFLLVAGRMLFATS